MAMSGIENHGPLQTLEAFHPIERFTSLVDAVLLYHGFGEADPEATCTWLSDDCLRYYELTRLTHDNDAPTYELRASTANNSEELIASYLLGPETEEVIRMLDSEGNVMKDALSSQFATQDVLEILMAEQPRFAQEDLQYHVDQEFQQLVGAYIISDRHIEKRLDRARSMRSTTNREHFTSEAIQRALSQFQSTTRHIIKEASGSIVDQAETIPYAQGYRHVTEEAVDRFAHSATRLYTRRRKR